MLGLFTLYSAVHLFTGDRSLFTWYELKQQIDMIEINNEALREKIANHENQITKLNPAAQDLDFVDELIRRTLPVLLPAEKIVLLKQAN